MISYFQILLQEAAERVSKITHTIINALGIVGLIIGIAETQQLNFRDPDRMHITIEMDLDMTLLRFTSIFSFLYMIFTIITGAFNNNVEDFPNELNIVNGVVAITQIILQISFIYNLKNKVNLWARGNFFKGSFQSAVFFSFHLGPLYTC